MPKKADKSSQEKNIQVGELPHKPHYEVRTASQSYSNIAAVLAGFAFAAVILVVQTTPPASSESAVIFRDLATIAFLMAFIGCVVSGFVFATVTGEEILAPRSHTMALLGGMGFSISSNLVMFGLATLTKIFLSPDITSFVKVIFPIAMFLSPLFVAFSAVDPIIGFEKEPIKTKDLVQLFSFSFLPLIFALLVKYFGSEIPANTILVFFKPVMVAAFIVILLSAASALSVSSFADIKFRLSLPISGIIVGIHSFVVGALILMI
jgi:hypothetical protein